MKEVTLITDPLPRDFASDDWLLSELAQLAVMLEEDRPADFAGGAVVHCFVQSNHFSQSSLAHLPPPMAC